MEKIVVLIWKYGKFEALVFSRPQCKNRNFPADILRHAGLHAERSRQADSYSQATARKSYQPCPILRALLGVHPKRNKDAHYNPQQNNVIKCSSNYNLFINSLFSILVKDTYIVVNCLLNLQEPFPVRQ